MINKKYIQPVIILILLVVIFIQRSCNSNTIIQKGKEIVKYDTVFKPSEIKTKIVTKYRNIKGDTIFIKGKIDTLTITKFEKATDPIKEQMFIEASKIRQYKNDFNDSVADVSIFTETKGELLKIAPKITIKARLPERKTVFALYGGFEVFNSLQLNSFGTKANLSFQNKRGDLFTTGYDTNKNIYLGYSFRFINFKK